ncbi:MAG: MerR family DNA-binding transcriptional regulator [Alphaproteobacteria bacterium]|nr:MerR family DNA-binding transcriptional regulator [Alphaproteobacteria bacterium]
MKFYKIREFSREIGISVSTLREYEKKGLLIPHHRGLNGYRYYSQEQVDSYLSGNLTRCGFLPRKGVSNNGC